MRPQGNLDQVFNLEPIPTVQAELVEQSPTDIQTVEAQPVAKLEKKIEDSNFIREELKALVARTKEALEVALDAQMNDTDPKASMAVASLSTTLAQALKTLIDLSKTESDREIKLQEKPKGPEKVTNITNNNLVISTSELIDKILQKTKPKELTDK